MNTLKNMFFVTMLTGPMLFSACSERTAEEQRDEMNDRMEKAADRMDKAMADASGDMETERQAILKDLRDLQQQIGTRLDAENKELARNDLKPSERAQKTELVAELERENKVVSDAISDVANSDTSTWDEVKIRARNTTNDVKKWWARLKENIDRRTDADHDRDGH